jgi:histidine triad (HIT) family protein
VEVEMSDDCVFCRIVRGDIPATIVRESERVLAFRDTSPQAPVHVLVIPREHHPDLAALAAADPDLAGELFREAAEVAAAEGVGAGWRLVVNTGAEAGQSVFHVHAHVMGGGRLGRQG